MTNEVWSAQEIEDKADWEGGYLSLYHWGGPNAFTAADASVQIAWQDFCSAAQDLDDAARELARALSKARNR